MRIPFIGLCCGNVASYIRTMAETLGRQPEASKFSPDMSKHLSQIKKTQESDFYKQRFPVKK